MYNSRSTDFFAVRERVCCSIQFHDIGCIKYKVYLLLLFRRGAQIYASGHAINLGLATIVVV